MKMHYLKKIYLCNQVNWKTLNERKVICILYQTYLLSSKILKTFRPTKHFFKKRNRNSHKLLVKEKKEKKAIFMKVRNDIQN